MRLSTRSPSGVLGAPPGHFAWDSDGPAAPVALIVCDASYVEVARIEGLDGGSFTPTIALAARLSELGTFHWFVEGRGGGRTVRSPFASCEIR